MIGLRTQMCGNAKKENMAKYISGIIATKMPILNISNIIAIKLLYQIVDCFWKGLHDRPQVMTSNHMIYP